MLRLRNIPLLCAALLALAAAPAPALADGDDVIRDCYEDGKLDRKYSDEDLEDAERDLPSDVDEYSDCRSVIRAARERGTKGDKGGTGGVPGGGFRGGGTATADPALSTPAGAQAASREDLDALDQIASRNRASSDEPKVPVGSQSISPSAGAAAVGESANDMPTPLLAALIAVGALGALGGAFAAWRRRPQLLRRGPLRFGRS
jgi:hypothetical protein